MNYERIKERRDFANFAGCRGCNQNLAGNDPASQYQRQKIIQNTVRVASSLYTMNLAALSSYQKPLITPQIVEQAGIPYYVSAKVNWNQMSDRATPSKQVAKVASGSTYRTSSTKHTVTCNRPGAMTPGGIGVDVKHNSYERRLNRLKGKSVLRRGIIPPNYGSPIPFSRAYPVYGGKVIKTGIINNCDCPDITNNLEANNRIYGSKLSAMQDMLLSIGYTFSVNEFVWTKKNSDDSTLYKAQITNIQDGIYTIRYTDDNVIANVSVSDLIIYFDCNCYVSPSIEETILANQYSASNIDELLDSYKALDCELLNIIAGSGLL